MKKVEILEREGRIPLKKSKIREITRFILNEENVKNYVISLVYAERSLMRELNKRYRKVDRSTNVLSFLYEESPTLSGEIIISRYHVEVKGEDFTKLYIHGLLHLLGYDHTGKKDRDKMREKENYYMEKVKDEP